MAVAQAILDKLETLKGSLIPANVHVEITRNYGKTANDKVNELLKAMFEAAIIVSILCLVGLGARAAFVVITVIPVVIVLTIWWAMMVDYTIDRVSLFALIFSIGILVDDATVVVENIFRHWLEVGKTSIAHAVRAVDEVGNPTILATLTIISALLPMGWVSGLMGPYMRPIPVLGSSAMAFSLFAAFVFTPWFTLRVRPKMASLHKAERREERTRRFVSKLYRPLVLPLIEHRSLGIAFLITDHCRDGRRLRAVLHPDRAGEDAAVRQQAGIQRHREHAGGHGPAGDRQRGPAACREGPRDPGGHRRSDLRRARHSRSISTAWSAITTCARTPGRATSW